MRSASCTRFSSPVSKRPALLGLAALGLVSLGLAAAPVHAEDLFVANFGNNSNTISRFAGTGPGTFSTTATALSGGLTQPDGLTFDTRGDLFVTDNRVNSKTITEFAAGATPGTFGATTTLTSPSLNGPLGLAFDASGDLFASNLNNGTITEFASTGLGTFGAPTTLSGGQYGLRGLAFDASGDLFATASNNTIIEFASTGAGTFSTTATALSDPNGTVNGPFGLAFDVRGDLFAANSNNGTITEFAFTPGVGAAPGTFGAAQTVERGLSAPFGLAFGPSVPPAVPEASTTVSLGLLLMLGMGGMVVAARRKKAARS